MDTSAEAQEPPMLRVSSMLVLRRGRLPFSDGALGVLSATAFRLQASINESLAALAASRGANGVTADAPGAGGSVAWYAP